MNEEFLKSRQEEIKDILIKVEEAGFLLKDGKQILAYNKMNGIKQKLASLYNKLSGDKAEKVIENDIDK